MAKSTETEDKGGSFDLDRFRRLLQLMEKFDVTEVSLQNDAESWKIRRGPRAVPWSGIPQGYAVPQMPPMQAAPAAAAAPVAAAPSAPAAPAEKAPGITINAPTVGTFYAAATPEDEPFVSVGSVVKPDTVICIIEAMKVFNQINAEKSGRITEVLVANGAAVEFGQPLFRLEPA